MSQAITIPELCKRLEEAVAGYSVYCSSVPDDLFFRQPGSKWSPAQQTKHLVKSTDMARLALSLPKFLVRWLGGKPNRPSRSYEELVAKYKMKLEQGGRASARYVPRPVLPAYGKDRLLKEFSRSMQQFARALEKNRTEADLENYLAPHPLLGKITLRELCYFTIHHCLHHLASVRELTEER